MPTQATHLADQLRLLPLGGCVGILPGRQWQLGAAAGLAQEGTHVAVARCKAAAAGGCLLGHWCWLRLLLPLLPLLRGVLLPLRRPRPSPLGLWQ